jgi:hypothetical protein
MQMVQNLLQQLQPKQDTPQDVKLSDTQRQNIATTLGVDSESIHVVDADKDGTVSAYDQIKATYTTDTGSTKSLSRTVDAGFALDINGKLGTPLDMNEVGLAERITNHLGISNGSFRDQDGSGSLSAGDVIKSVSYDPGGQGTPSYYTLTTADMQSLKDAKIYPPVTPDPKPAEGASLPLSDQQRSNITNGVRFPYAQSSISILDQDSSNTISAGDLFKSQDVGGAAYEHNLSANEAALISGQFGASLTLSDSDRQRLSTALAILPRVSSELFMGAFDRDGSGTLSSGDIAISHRAAMGSVSPPLFPISYAELEVTPDGVISGKKI